MEKLATRPLHNVALAALPLVAVLLAGVVVVNENQRWEAWGERLALHQQKLAEADYRRPPLAGEAQSGNAFDDYARAVALAEPLLTDPAADLMGLWLLPHERLCEPDAELRLAKWRAAMELVRIGAHRTHAEPPAARDPRVQPVRFLASRQLMFAAVLEARRHILVGESRPALELVLEATGMALDTARSPRIFDSMVGVALLQIALRDGLSTELLAGLDTPSREMLLVALDRIDATLPFEFPLRLEQAHCFDYADDLEGDVIFGVFHRWQQRKALDAGRISPDSSAPDPRAWTDLRIHVRTLRAAVERSLGGWRSERETRVDGGGSGRRGVHGAGQRPAGS